MHKIYADGSYSKENNMGTYCIVVAEQEKRPDWYVKSFDHHTSSEVESAALSEAIDVGWALAVKTGIRAAAYTDSKVAIGLMRNKAKNLGIRVHFIKGHQLPDLPRIPNDDVKRQHWADTLAYNFLKLRISRSRIFDEAESLDTIS